MGLGGLWPDERGRIRILSHVREVSADVGKTPCPLRAPMTNQFSLNDVISLLANISIALSFLMAIIFDIAQVCYAARDRRERLGLDALRNFQSREFAELIHHIMSHDMPKSRQEFNALPTAPPWPLNHVRTLYTPQAAVHMPEGSNLQIITLDSYAAQR